MHASFRLRALALGVSVVLASCGGGGGDVFSGSASSCPPLKHAVAAPPAWLTYTARPNGGSGPLDIGLFVVPSSDTRQSPRRVDAQLIQSRSQAYVFQRDAQGRITTARPSVLYYIAGDGLYRLDLGAVAVPVPVRISPASIAAASLCGWKVSQTRLTDAASSFVLLRLPGADSDCNTPDDAVHLFRYADTPAMASAPVPGATEAFTPFYDAAGQLSGLLAKMDDRLVMASGPDFLATRTLASTVLNYSTHAYSGRDAILQITYEAGHASFQHLGSDGSLSPSLHDSHATAQISTELTPDGRYFAFMERDWSGYVGPTMSTYTLREKVGRIPADGGETATFLFENVTYYSSGLPVIYVPPRNILTATQNRIVIVSREVWPGNRTVIETLPIDTPASPQEILSSVHEIYQATAVNGDVLYFDLMEGVGAAARLDAISGELQVVANARWLGVAGQRPQSLADRATGARESEAAAILLAEDLPENGRLEGARVSAVDFSKCESQPLKQADGSAFRFPDGYFSTEPILSTALTGLGYVPQPSSAPHGYQADVLAFDISRSRMDLLTRTPGVNELP